MGSIYLRKYGAATTIDFCLYELDGTDLKVDAAHAAGDIAMMRDEGDQVAPAAGFVDEGTGYSLALSAAEMQAARIVIYIIDQTSPKVWLDKCLIIETYGHASGQHVFDLGTATVKTDKDDEIDAIKAKTDNLPSDPADESLLEAEINANETKIDALQADVTLIKGYTDTEVAAILDAVDTEVAAIKAKTDLIPAAPATEGKQDIIIGYIDTEIAAIKAVTDTLSLVAIADAVHDEAVEGTYTLRQLLKLISAATAGKLSGGGTNILTFRDVNDSKDRITATVDANKNRTDIALDVT